MSIRTDAGTTGHDATLTAGELFKFAARLSPDTTLTAVLVLDQGWARLRANGPEGGGPSIYMNAIIEGRLP